MKVRPGYLKTNKTDKHLGRLIKKIKEEGSNQHNQKLKEVKIDTTEMQRIIRDHYGQICQ